MQDPDLRQRQVALYNATCVHASFGDAELAQVTLRGASPVFFADGVCRCSDAVRAHLISYPSNAAQVQLDDV